MSLDYVHDIQQIYRRVVDALSYPGEVHDISQFSSKSNIKSNMYNSTLSLALLLLDSEVTFCVVSSTCDDDIKLIQQLTHAKHTNLNKAKYVFVLNDLSQNNLVTTIKDSNKGDLIDPHNSATLIIECNDLYEGDTLKLIGPGIKDENYISLILQPGWVDERETKNKEFPLGIDIIIVDKKGKLIALPRTTQIS